MNTQPSESQPPQPIPEVSSTNTCTYCPFCSVQLSYPDGSLFIQCPKCCHTMNPAAPQQTPCTSCGILLAHSSRALYLQCPKCLHVMNIRENDQMVTQIIPIKYFHYVPAPKNLKAQAEQQHLSAMQDFINHNSASTQPSPAPQARLSNPSPSGKEKSASEISDVINDGQDALLPDTARAKRQKSTKSSTKPVSNAYTMFCKENRPILKAESPDLAFGKIGSKLGELWRRLTSEQKRPYEIKAGLDRQRKDEAQLASASGTQPIQPEQQLQQQPLQTPPQLQVTTASLEIELP